MAGRVGTGGPTFSAGFPLQAVSLSWDQDILNLTSHDLAGPMVLLQIPCTLILEVCSALQIKGFTEPK